MGSSIGSILGTGLGIGAAMLTGGASVPLTTTLMAGGLGGMLGSGYDASQAAKKAAEQQAAATGQANQTLTGMYGQNYANLAPWMGYGQNAGNQLQYMLGLGPQSGTGANTAMGAYGSLTSPFSLSQFNQDPSYAFRLQQGQQALERSGAARGMTLSGAQAKALQGYGQGMASQEYQNAFNRDMAQKQNLYNMLSGTSQQGMAAGSALAGVGQNTANQIGGYYTNLGAGQAASTLAANNAAMGGVNTMANLFQNPNNISQMGDWFTKKWGS